MARSITKLIEALGEFGGTAIGPRSLLQAIEVFNETRSLLRTLYELRKRETPPVSGNEASGIVAAATVMPKDLFNEEMKAVLQCLDGRKASVSQIRPRLLVSSDRLDDAAYLKLLEDDALVAMDDLDTGSRYFWQMVNTGLDDPVNALARRYLGVASPRMISWKRQAEQVVEWAKDWKINGVVELPLRYSYPRAFRTPFFRKSLDEAGIPNISIERDYLLTNVGQLRTRIQAFLEMFEFGSRR
jgi:benzoyl-CoA reductase/2-hydroxyglutaryl-CoA dehydratase subunit BcrC/BadD/HgdB